MQVVKKFFIVLFVVWFALLLFMPKKEIFYTLERNLEAQGVQINEKEIDEGLFSLNLIDATIFYKGIKVATVEKINIFTLLFTTNIHISTLELDDALKAFAPQKIDSADITQLLFAPYTLNITALGSFGEMKGLADLKSGKLRLDFLNTTKEIDVIRPNLQKDEKGWYYETSF
jgi:hypothetical protein